jgi:hypothetical protein
MDAAPPPPVRTCIDYNAIVSTAGLETLTLQFRCGDPSDGVGSVSVEVYGPGGPTDDPRVYPITINCGAPNAFVFQTPITFPAGSTGTGSATTYHKLYARLATGSLFSVECTGSP